MAIIEYDRKWTFTTTGAGEWEPARHATEHTWTLETSTGSSCRMVIETRVKGGVYAAQVGSSMVVDVSTASVQQFTGPYYQLRPRLLTLSSAGPVIVHAVGN